MKFWLQNKFHYKKLMIMYDLKDVKVKMIFSGNYNELESLINDFMSQKTSYQFIDIKYQMTVKSIGYSAMIIYSS